MADERSSDLPGGSDDPIRDDEPVDTADAQGAGPAAGMGLPGRRGETFSEDPLAREAAPGEEDRSTAAWLYALLAVVVVGIVVVALLL